MTAKLSRRQILRLALLSGSGAVLAACSFWERSRGT